jgi:hypothetical protein
MISNGLYLALQLMVQVCENVAFFNIIVKLKFFFVNDMMRIFVRIDPIALSAKPSVCGWFAEAMCFSIFKD